MALTPRDKRVLMIGGGVVGAALVLFLVFNVLGGGGEETAAPPAPPPGELPTVAPSPTESPSQVVNFSGRDPFSAPPALASAATSAAPIDAAGGDAGTGDTTSTIAPPADTGTFSPPATGGTGGTGTGTPGPTNPPKPEPTCKGKRKTECYDVGNHTVEILRVYMRHHRLFADVKVDEKKEYKELKQGDRFAHNFKLVGFNDHKCPRFIFGEEAFTLCEQHKRR